MTKTEYQRTYSLSEIARKLDRPRTTLKDYADLFIEYLPTTGEGRTMRYKEDAIELFAMIAEMKNRNEPNEVIRQALGGVVKEITVKDEESGAQPLIAGIIESYNRMTTELRLIAESMNSMEQRHKEEMALILEQSAIQSAATLEMFQTVKGLLEQREQQMTEQLQQAEKREQELTVEMVGQALNLHGLQSENHQIKVEQEAHAVEITEMRKVIAGYSERDKQLNAVMEELLTVKAQLAAAQEGKSKSFWQKLFKK